MTIQNRSQRQQNASKVKGMVLISRYLAGVFYPLHQWSGKLSYSVWLDLTIHMLHVYCNQATVIIIIIIIRLSEAFLA